jgi:hypothetical protein
VAISEVVRFASLSFMKARHMKVSDLKPARGRHAPPPSVRSLVVYDSSPTSSPVETHFHGTASGSSVEAVEMRVSSTARTATYPGAHEPTRRTTFLSETLPARTLTFDESNVGL